MASILPDLIPMIYIEEVTMFEDLKGLCPEWSDLWRRCPSATPFQSAEWLIAWWKYFGSGELWTLALRHKGRLLGLAPLFIFRNQETSERHVLLIGTGITDYLDVLLDPEVKDFGADIILSYLLTRCNLWDVCDFHQLRPGSPLLTARSPAGSSDEFMIQETCPVLFLPNTVEELSQAVPKRMIDNLRYYKRRAEKIGSTQVDCALRHNFEEIFEALLRLHSSRWAIRRLPGVLSDDNIQKFHREAAYDLLLVGLLRLYALRLSGRIIAAFYGFTCRRRSYYYLSGFDPEFEKLSAGTLVVGYAIEEAIREGVKEFDFLRGCEPYKYRWGAKDRFSYRRFFRHTIDDKGML